MPGKRLPVALQTAALLVRGETGDGNSHLQIMQAHALPSLKLNRIKSVS
ncbi:MAG: hypothetical protein JO170_20790 [Verrucomicrobia bacterium]|nr:hypothetical protein [Verrucomicrobiota bacterium]